MEVTRKELRRSISTWMPADLVERLDTFVHKFGQSRNWAVRIAIEEFLDKYEDSPAELLDRNE